MDRGPAAGNLDHLDKLEKPARANQGLERRSIRGW